MAVKITVAVLALVGAGYFAFLRGDPDAEQDNTPESAVPYACRSCAHGMMLTPAEFDAMLKQGLMGSDGEERGRAALRCPKCQKLSINRGVRCPKDGQVFLPYKNGQKMQCPKCRWIPPDPS